MKRFITIAALLAASSAFAGAASVIFTADVGSDGSLVFTNTSGEKLVSFYGDFSVAVTFTAGSSSYASGTNLFLLRSANSSDQQGELRLNGVNSAKVDIGTYYAASNATWHTSGGDFSTTRLAGTNPGTNTLTMSFSGSSDSTPVQYTSASYSVSFANGDSVTNQNFSYSSTTQSNVLKFSNDGTGTIAAWTNVAYGNGTGVSVSKVTLTVDDSKISVIPEPSAFGLLAGIGALAFAISRRRRSR